MKVFELPHSEVFQEMDDLRVKHIVVSADDANGEPIAAVIYIRGAAESKEVLRAVDAIVYGWIESGEAVDVINESEAK